MRSISHICSAAAALVLLTSCAQLVPGTAAAEPARTAGTATSAPRTTQGVPPTNASAPVVPYYQVRVGQCFDDDDVDPTVGTEVVIPGMKYVEIRDCSTPHQSEATATFAVDDGYAAVLPAARKRCVDAAKAYVGDAAALPTLNISYVFPLEGSYKSGYHTVLCGVQAKSGTLTRSVR